MRGLPRAPGQLGATCLAVVSSLWACSDPRDTRIDVPAETQVEDVLKRALYAPFDRETLLDEPEDAYGTPDMVGSEGDHVTFLEYVGDVGRVRVYMESYIDPTEGPIFSTWLESYPETLYLDDVLAPEYSLVAATKDGAWTLHIAPEDRSWRLSFRLDGRAIQSIIDQPK